MKIRNGRVVDGTLMGDDYNLKQLDPDQLMTLDRLVSKQRAGAKLTGDELTKLMKIRADARAHGGQPAHSNPLAQAAAAIAELKAVFR